METTVHNLTRGALRVVGKVLPRWTFIILDVADLAEPLQAELRAAEVYGSVRCNPRLTPPAVVLPEAQAVIRAPIQERPALSAGPTRGKKAKGAR